MCFAEGQLVSPDINKRPVTLCLPVLTSPDIDPDIVLVSHCQLLKLGYCVKLSSASGQIITPHQRIIKLTVKNNTWHFPPLASNKQCTLDVDPATANMVLKHGTFIRMNQTAQVQASPPPADAPVVSCTDQEPALEASISESRTEEYAHVPPSSHPEQHSVHISDTTYTSQDTNIQGLAAPSTQSPAQPQDMHNFHDEFLALLPHVVNTSLSDDASSASQSQQRPPMHEALINNYSFINNNSFPNNNNMSQRPAQMRSPDIGSALSQEEALALCKKVHSIAGHCSKAMLQALLCLVKDPTKRQSADHIKLFVCPDCAMAKLKKLAQCQTHPSRDKACEFLPGKFLHVDGSGTFKFLTIDKSTPYFIIVD